MKSKNLKSEGTFNVCITYRREDSGVADTDISTATCEGARAIRGMADGDVIVVKFNRQELAGAITIQV